jgi:hypothetical protein
MLDEFGDIANRQSLIAAHAKDVGMSKARTATSVINRSKKYSEIGHIK